MKEINKTEIKYSCNKQGREGEEGRGRGGWVIKLKTLGVLFIFYC